MVAWRIVAFSRARSSGFRPPGERRLDGELSASKQGSLRLRRLEADHRSGAFVRGGAGWPAVHFTYYGDALGNLSGGVQQGLGYSGRFGTIVDADLEKLVGCSARPSRQHSSDHGSA